MPPKPADKPRRDRLAEKLSARRDEAIADLKRLDDATIDAIVRRSRQAAQPDGFPASTLGEGTGHSGNVSNPTATAAERHAGGSAQLGTPDSWREEADPVRDTIRELDGLLHDIARSCRSLDRKRQYVTSNPKVGRQSTVGDCQACATTVTGVGNDRLRAGYCSACYSAWMRADYPDRHQFEQTRREREAS